MLVMHKRFEFKPYLASFGIRALYLFGSLVMARYPKSTYRFEVLSTYFQGTQNMVELKIHSGDLDREFEDCFQEFVEYLAGLAGGNILFPDTRNIDMAFIANDLSYIKTNINDHVLRLHQQFPGFVVPESPVKELWTAIYSGIDLGLVKR